jgi:uncharacterized membrane protein YfcA
MWQTYWKRFPVMQGMILILCAIMLFVIKLHWVQVAATFVIMQLGAVLGAWYGTRLRKRIESRPDDLSLRR